MTVAQLIEKLKELPQDLPICIDDYMGFAEAYEDSMQIEQKEYQCFPYTDADKFTYINLTGAKVEE